MPTGYTTIGLGNGTGSFVTATPFLSDYAAVDLGDLNGDGILDLVTAGSGRASVSLGVGNGTFSTGITYTMESGNTLGIELGDLNGDGVLDLLTTGTASGGRATVRLTNTQNGLGALVYFSLNTKASALQAIGPMRIMQVNLSKQRGAIGAS